MSMSRVVPCSAVACLTGHPGFCPTVIFGGRFTAPCQPGSGFGRGEGPVSYTHLRAHETSAHL
eukprot:1578442-Alexandrium_andersonii.AAC.1